MFEKLIRIGFIPTVNYILDESFSLELEIEISPKSHVFRERITMHLKILSTNNPTKRTLKTYPMSRLCWKERYPMKVDWLSISRKSSCSSIWQIKL
jgi:hypothetical protein